VTWSYQYSFPSEFSAQMSVFDEYLVEWKNVFKAALDAVYPANTLTVDGITLTFDRSGSGTYNFPDS